MHLKNSKIIVIKIGSSLLVNENKQIRQKWLSTFAKDIQKLVNLNKKVVIVSSGAIAMGCIKMNINKKNLQERLKQRKSLNRYDKFKMSFYNKVQNGFLKLSKRQKNKYQLINSNLEIHKNEKFILNRIDKLIK